MGDTLDPLGLTFSREEEESSGRAILELLEGAAGERYSFLTHVANGT
jgi:hypothetical protein